ncbi:MAG: AAA family ATPase [Lachnospiraceae bacterium]|nr:AAA family ATPase [Lachnospiraceae bacterium]
MRSLYISRVVIRNYRNFKDVDIRLGHKQIIIGENNIGKTNFIRALQLILDPTLSDEDRRLDESDFNNTLANPMENDEEIEISIYISNYRGNVAVLAMLQGATVRDNDMETLKITYRFFPHTDDNGNKEYEYVIFMQDDVTRIFGAAQRKYLNIKVIKALRDVEGEMKNSRLSPVKKMLDEYAIDKAELERIAEEYRKSGEQILNIDEIEDLTQNINKRFNAILGNGEHNVSLQAMEVDPTKVLSSLKLLMENRNAADVSLGWNNILYISMILQTLQDKTVPTFMRREKYEELMTRPDSDILSAVYTETANGNFFLDEKITEQQKEDIYAFMNLNAPTYKGTTILVIEEPEAHLHPVNQRLVFRDVIQKSNNSVLLTTHSTHITAISPINSIVHLHSSKDGGTLVHATASMPMDEGEFLDVERYLDVKRGEIYLAKAVILVEGIAEEYLVPRFAELLGKSLDEKGIIICNINCTNFKPYVKLLRCLDVPYAVITDGDFYHIPSGQDEREYHVMYDDVSDDEECGYLGLEIIKRMVTELEINGATPIPDSVAEEDELYNSYGIFLGNYTFEVDMMEHCHGKKKATDIIVGLFNELTTGKEAQKANFKREIEEEKYWKCLKKIESNGIGKGRFAQKLASRCCKEHIPGYIKSAIEYIYEKVDK